MKINVNGTLWSLIFVSGQHEKIIVDNNPTAGATYFLTKEIYINNEISVKQQKETVIHELSHAFLVETQIVLSKDSNTLFYTEENLCDFIAMYGRLILDVANVICP